ncbi:MULTISPECIES: glycosyltransferase [Sphingobacterium]|uniref:glycosyltransferase n=1 Tax=Sphingobacterium TaxID=28453 RepID=UPI002580BAA5|nr:MULTISPECIES: glycosyltransferase [Sphingobacterium]
MSFSVLISCFVKDNPNQLDKCLKSISEQSLRADEIVFVKDGPLTDSLESVLNSYKDSLPFKFISFDVNHGLGYSLNKGLLECSFDIVIRMDTDDICLVDRFKRQFEYMSHNPHVDILGGWAYDIDQNDNIIAERKYPSCCDDIYKLMWTNPLIHPTICFRRSRIIEIGSYNPKIIRRQDYDLWIRAAYAGFKIENMPEFLIKYRFTDNYYSKNGWKVTLNQAMMGYRGAKLLGLPFYTRIAVFAPVIRTLLPKKFVGKVHKLMGRYDPRKNIRLTK